MTDLHQIYHQHFQDVYRFLLSLSRDEHVAEELTQETFFKALKHIDSFQGTCKLSVWLCQIAKHTYFSISINKSGMSRLRRSTTAAVRISYGKPSKRLRLFASIRSCTGWTSRIKRCLRCGCSGNCLWRNQPAFGKTESWARVTFFRAKQKSKACTRRKTDREPNIVRDYSGFAAFVP